MKIAFAFVLVLALARGFPQPEVDSVAEVLPEERSLVVNIILYTLENLRDFIVENDLDPLSEDRVDLDFTGLGWVIDGLFSATRVTSNGLSGFVINRMNYAALTSRLTFDLAMPQLSFGMGSASFRGKVGDYEANAEGGGRIAVFNPRIWGRVRVSVGLITGITIRELEINFNVDRIESDIAALNINGEDLADQANDLLGNVIPTFINENQDLVRDYLTSIVQGVIDSIL